jgi:hypothetical protein
MISRFSSIKIHDYWRTLLLNCDVIDELSSNKLLKRGDITHSVCGGFRWSSTSFNGWKLQSLSFDRIGGANGSVQTGLYGRHASQRYASTRSVPLRFPRCSTELLSAPGVPDDRDTEDGQQRPKAPHEPERAQAEPGGRSRHGWGNQAGSVSPRDHLGSVWFNVRYRLHFDTVRMSMELDQLTPGANDQRFG